MARQVVFVEVREDVGAGPVGERAHLHEAVAFVPGDGAHVGAGGRLVSTKARDPRLAAFEGTSEGQPLAEVAAAVGVDAEQGVAKALTLRGGRQIGHHARDGDAEVRFDAVRERQGFVEEEARVEQQGRDATSQPLQAVQDHDRLRTEAGRERQRVERIGCPDEDVIGVDEVVRQRWIGIVFELREGHGASGRTYAGGRAQPRRKTGVEGEECLRVHTPGPGRKTTATTGAAATGAGGKGHLAIHEVHEARAVETYRGLRGPANKKLLIASAKRWVRDGYARASRRVVGGKVLVRIWLAMVFGCAEPGKTDAAAVMTVGSVEVPSPEPEPAPEPEPEPVTDPMMGLSVDDREAKLFEMGAQVYAADGVGRCAVCHGDAGEGIRGAMPPLVGDRPWMNDCFRQGSIVLFGMTGTIVVDGLTYDGVMPPQGDQLGDLDVAAVSTFVNRSWGNDGPVCDPYDIAVLRVQGPTSWVD